MYGGEDSLRCTLALLKLSAYFDDALSYCIAVCDGLRRE